MLKDPEMGVVSISVLFYARMGTVGMVGLLFPYPSGQM